MEKNWGICVVVLTVFSFGNAMHIPPTVLVMEEVTTRDELTAGLSLLKRTLVCTPFLDPGVQKEIENSSACTCYVAHTSTQKNCGFFVVKSVADDYTCLFLLAYLDTLPAPMLVVPAFLNTIRMTFPKVTAFQTRVSKKHPQFATILKIAGFSKVTGGQEDDADLYRITFSEVEKRGKDKKCYEIPYWSEPLAFASLEEKKRE